MSIWNNTFLGAANKVGYASTPQTPQIGPGIVVQPIDLRPFLDSSSGSGRTASGGTSRAAAKDDDAIKGRTATVNVFKREKERLESIPESLMKSYSSKIYDAEYNGDITESNRLKQELESELNQTFEKINNLKVSLAQEEALYGKQVEAATTEINKRGSYNDIAIRGGASTIKSGEDIFYGDPFLMSKQTDKKGNTIINPVTYGEAIENQYTDIKIDPKTGKSIAFDGFEYTADEKTVRQEIDKYIGEAASTELGDPNIINEFNRYVIVDAQQAMGTNRLAYTTNGLSLQNIINNAYEKLPEESKRKMLSETVKTGVNILTNEEVPAVDDKGNPIIKNGKQVMQKKTKYVDGKILLSMIEEQRAKALSPQRKNESNEEYQKRKDEANKKGLELSNALITQTKVNTYLMAKGQAIGRFSLSYNTETGNGEGSSSTTPKEATDFMALMETAMTQDQNLYYNVKGEDKFGKLVNKGGTSTTKAFNMNEDAKLYQIKGLFNVPTLKDLRDQNLSLNDMPGKFMFNGIYVDRDIVTPEDQSTVKLKGMGAQGYILPKFHNPTGDDKISTEIYQTKGGQAVLAPYVELEFTTENGSLELPVYDKDRIVYKKISEILDKNVDTGYDVKYVGDNVYEFTVLKEATNPYAGTKNTSQAGLIANQMTTAEVESARPFIQKMKYENQQKRLSEISASSGVKYGGELYGKPIERDAKKAIQQLSNGIKGNRNYNIQLLQAIDDLVESANENDRDAYRQELLKEYKELTKPTDKRTERDFVLESIKY